VYGAEAGPEEGWGFADFGRTIRVAAVVFAWAVFQDYLARELKRSYPSYDLSEYSALAVLVEEDVRSWDRRFEQIKKRYRDFAGIALSELPSWGQVLHAQELRNAIVHNQGQYTRAYLRTKLAYRPTEEDLHGFAPPAADAGLIDHEVIPLSLTLADAVITQLCAAATEVRDAIDQARRNRVRHRVRGASRSRFRLEGGAVSLRAGRPPPRQEEGRRIALALAGECGSLTSSDARRRR
jgi:hypothetical protein